MSPWKNPPYTPETPKALPPESNIQSEADLDFALRNICKEVAKGGKLNIPSLAKTLAARLWPTWRFMNFVHSTTKAVGMPQLPELSKALEGAFQTLDNPPLSPYPGVEVVVIPSYAGECRGITEFQGKVFIACSNGVFQFNPADGILYPVAFNPWGNGETVQ